jgi:hypothetical protein
VKPAGISGIKKAAISERQNYELTTNSENKNIKLEWGNKTTCLFWHSAVTSQY